jgi:hypothetical protein
MDAPIILPFEVTGGSPIQLEVTKPDGEKIIVRLATTIMSIRWDGVSMDKLRPDLPVLIFEAKLVTAWGASGPPAQAGK